MLREGGFLLRFGILLGCLALAAVNTGNNLLYLIFSIMIAVAAVSFFVTGRSLARVRADLQLPEEVVAGEPFLLGLRTEARPGRLPSPWARALVTGPEGALPELELPALAPGDRTVVCGPARVSLRGVHRGMKVTLRSRYPFNLFARSRRVRQGSALVVTPRRFPIRSLKVPTPDSAGSVAASRPGDGTELHNIRDYTPVDDARHIDWKASARMDRPMLREFEREHERALDLVLDESPFRGARPGAFDAMMETAASILDHCAESGIRARLLVAGPGAEAVALEGRDAMIHLAGAAPRTGPLPQLYGRGTAGVPRVILSLNPEIRTSFEIHWQDRRPEP
jgi:uncharacterized protein (DUF58 family)